MRALSLVQPMGWAIVYGHKPYENRVRDMRPLDMRGVRTRVAIHNGKRWDDGYADMVYRLTGVIPQDAPGKVIGIATFTGRVFTLNDPPPADAVGRAWFVGPFAFEIDTSESFALPVPITSRGMLGFWTMSPAVESGVRGQVRHG